MLGGTAEESGRKGGEDAYEARGGEKEAGRKGAGGGGNAKEELGRVIGGTAEESGREEGWARVRCEGR